MEKIQIYIRRYFAAFCCRYLIFLLVLNKSFYEISFAQDINIFYLIGMDAFFFAALTLIAYGMKSYILDLYVLATGIGTIAIILLNVIAKQGGDNNQKMYAALPILVIVAILAVYIMIDDKLELWRIKIKRLPMIIIISVIAAFFIIMVSLITVLRYLSYSAPGFDFGIFSQMFHYMKTTFIPYTTCERDVLLSHFAVHFSPIYYLILPFYVIFPSPITLQIAQAVVLGSSVIPLFLIMKHYKLSNKAMVVLSAVLLFYPALAGGTFYDIHENMFLTPLLLWLFYFFEKKKLTGMVIFALLVCMVKEDAAVYVLFFALFLIMSKKEYIKGAVMAALGGAYFVLVLYFMRKYGLGVMTYRYDALINGEGGLLGVVYTVFANPGYVFKMLLSTSSWGVDKLFYVLKMFLPIAFLPFITKKISRLTLVFPMLLVNLMTFYVYQYDITFQYSFATTAFLFYASVMNFSELSAQAKRTISAVALSIAICLTVITTQRRVSRYLENKEIYAQMNEALAEIPTDASVRATTFLVAHLSARDELYEFGGTTAFGNEKNKIATDFLAFDMRPGHYGTQIYNYIVHYKSLGYTVFIEKENAVLIMVSEEYLAKNQ